jgi:hypothetical protein
MNDTAAVKITSLQRCIARARSARQLDIVLHILEHELNDLLDFAQRARSILSEASNI